jgi:hypothetical protein
MDTAADKKAYHLETALVVAVMVAVVASVGYSAGRGDHRFSLGPTPEAPVVVPANVAATSTETRALAAAPSGRLCTANDLVGTADWMPAGDHIDGVVRVRNSSASGCVLSRGSRVEIHSGSRVLASLQTAWPAQSIRIGAGDGAAARFTWSNWCGAPLSSQAKVKFVLPDPAGYLLVPVVDQTGRARTDSPDCVAPASPSTVSLSW